MRSKDVLKRSEKCDVPKRWITLGVIASHLFFVVGEEISLQMCQPAKRQNVGGVTPWDAEEKSWEETFTSKNDLHAWVGSSNLQLSHTNTNSYFPLVV